MVKRNQKKKQNSLKSRKMNRKYLYRIEKITNKLQILSLRNKKATSEYNERHFYH